MKFPFLIVFFLSLNLFAQNGFNLEQQKKIVIPFKLINNLIFVPLNVNGAELTFLLDTGVSETILFSLENKKIDFKNIEKMKFSGLGENVEIEGLKAIHNKVRSGNFYDKDHTIFIILNEDFNFSSHVGIPINGIIGYHFFKNHRVEINYSKKKITIESAEKTDKKLKKYKSFPITLELNKPYIYADVEQINERKNSKMLIDLGNSDALWLFPSLIEGFKYNRPNIDDYLGRGFNGDIFGKRSRIHNLYLGNFHFEKPLVAMPDEYSIQHLRLVENRKGSIGSEILRRFNMVIDYPNNTIYLKKNGFYEDPFYFNGSGLDIKHDGMIWESDLVPVQNEKKKAEFEGEVNAYSASSTYQYKFSLKPTYSVAGCREDSPAFIAGVRKNDKLLTLNGKKIGDFTLEKINKVLKSDEGKTIKLEVERNNQKLAFTFQLEDPIPYKED